MGASAYVGRVGRLAVALGVGTAIVTGQGIATADDSDTTPNTSKTASDTAGQAPNTASEPGAAASAQTPGTPPASPSKSESDATEPPSEHTPAASGVVTAQTNTGAATASATPTGTATATATSEPTAPSGQPPAETEPSSGARADADGSDRKSKKSPTAAETKTETHENPATPEPPSDPAAKAVTTTSAATATEPVPAAGGDVVEQRMTTALQAPTPSTARTAVVQDAAPPSTPFDIVTNLVSRVVRMVLGPVFSSGPAAPADAPLGWTMLAFARREIENFVAAVTGGSSQAAAVTSLAGQTTGQVLRAAAVAAAVNVPGFPLPGAQLSPSTSFVQWVTGNYQTGNPLIADTLKRFGVSGTDVGTMWDNGIPDDPLTPDYNEHQVLIAFGDTFGLRSVPGEDWRFNVLARSADTDLSNGMEVPDGEFGNGNWFGGMPLWDVPNGRPYDDYARRIINPEALPPGVTPGITLIPTAGIALPTTDKDAVGHMKQYLSFMSVTQWGQSGQWTTNFSGIATSIDNGENWTIAPTSIRYNDPYSGNANFQQAAFVRGSDGYVYAYGTPNGRQGAAYLSRVLEKDILDVTKYEYYSKGTAGGWFGWGAKPAGWYKNQASAATAVFGADQGACGVANPGNQVSEMSVQYNKQLKKYVVLYGDQFNNIVMRTSDTPQGTWSAAKVLMAQQQGGIYAPMMHPWSPSTLGTGSDLYWNLSLWSEYNVMLMKTDLTKV